MHRIFAAVAFAAVLVAGPAAFGQEARKYDYSDTVTVVEVAPEEQRLVVQDDTGRSLTLRFDEKTEIRSGARTVAAGELAQGDRVAVDARRESAKPEGQLVAERIALVVDDPPVSAPPPSE
jgi:hypothetical protein